MWIAPIFFNGWGELVRTLVLALLAYAAMVVLLRVARKRTLAKMNVFDFVFIVALGSILADTILSTEITLAMGLVAFGTLVAAQWMVSWLTTTSDRAERIVNGEPALLVHRGQCLSAAMRRERVTDEELRSAVRLKGLAALEEAEAVVLETDGSFSVIERKPGRTVYSSLADVPAHEGH